jgi:hypothetical protein
VPNGRETEPAAVAAHAVTRRSLSIPKQLTGTADGEPNAEEEALVLKEIGTATVGV